MDITSDITSHYFLLSDEKLPCQEPPISKFTANKTKKNRQEGTLDCISYPQPSDMGGSASVNSSSSSSPAIETNTAKNTDIVIPVVAVAPVVAVVEEQNEPVVVTIVPSQAVSPAIIPNSPPEQSLGVATSVVPSQAISISPAINNPEVPVEQPSGLGTLNVYYGTATGTAMGFARTLAIEGNQKGFKARAIDLEDLDPASLAISSSSLSIFVMATTGEGSSIEPPPFLVSYNMMYYHLNVVSYTMTLDCKLYNEWTYLLVIHIS